MKTLERATNKENVLIDYSLTDKQYIISQGDFEKVEEYCENECMGIKFLMNAAFLKKLVRSLLFANFQPPFTTEDFKSEKFRKFLKDNGIIELMQNQFGTDDVELIAKIVIKSTYNFLHKT